MTNKRLLIITEYIAPVNAVASIRWTKLAKYLSMEHGYIVDVLTNEKDFSGTKPKIAQYRYDNTLEADKKFLHEFIYIPTGSWAALVNIMFSQAKRSYENIKGFKRRQLESTSFENADSTLRKKPRTITHQGKAILHRAHERLLQKEIAKSALALGIDWEEYDVVVSSYGPRWTHLVAAAAKQYHPKHIWIADFRDPPAALEGGREKKSNALVRKITHRADCVVAVSDGGLLALAAPEGQRAEVVYNGYDPSETAIRTRSSNSFFTITYTGTLYCDGEKKSDLSPIFEALETLASENAINSNLVRVIYAGGSDDQFIDQISRYPSVKGECHGLVAREEAMAFQNEASLLLLCAWNTPSQQGCVTGKVFEYLTSGVPIVCLCSGSVADSELRSVIEGANAGICYEEATGKEDSEKLKEFVKTKYDEWLAEGITSCDANKGFIARFSHRNLAKRIDAIIETIELEELDNEK